MADLQQRLSGMKNSTVPGPDMIHAYWLKKQIFSPRTSRKTDEQIQTEKWLWSFVYQPDNVISDKQSRTVDVAIPNDRNIRKKDH